MLTAVLRRYVVVGTILLLAQIALADANKPTLLVRSDLECKWTLDGEQKGVLKPEDRLRVSVDLGQHLVEAVSSDGKLRWEKIIEAKEPVMQIVDIQFQRPSMGQKSLASTIPAEQLSLPGTAWQGSMITTKEHGKPYSERRAQREASQVTFLFKSDGKVVITGDGSPDIVATWTLNGATISAEKPESRDSNEFTFTGTLHGDSIEGTVAIYVANKKHPERSREPVIETAVKLQKIS